MDWTGLIMLLMSVFSSLLCITIHELSHGLAAWKLGDPTAKDMGRLTLNPIRHIDPFGLLMMVTARVGWAKPVPVDMRNFRRPKRDMAITALAGPASNFVLAWLALVLANLWLKLPISDLNLVLYPFIFFTNLAVLSTGLGVFNLIPIPPLDGSRILFSLLPDQAYYTVMRYERYIMIAMLVLVWLGLFQGPLSAAIRGVMRVLCLLSGLPFETMEALYF